MKDLVEFLVDRSKAMGVTYAEVRVTEKNSQSVALQDGRADRLYQSRTAGLGVRVLVDGAWGFAATGVYDRRSAETALEQAVALARQARPMVKDPAVVAPAEALRDTVETTPERPPEAMSIAGKTDLLKALDDAARGKHGSLIVNSIVSYGDATTREVMANSYGTLIEIADCRSSVSSMVVAGRDALRQRSTEVKAIHGGVELLERTTPEELTLKAADKAVAQLSAKPCPAGCFPVVFHPTITGLLMHEARGSKAEADAVWTGNSILAGRTGQQVAAECVTIVDDPTMAGYYGSYRYDSQGVPARRRVIVKNGVLETFLNDLESAGRLGLEPNGAGRAEDYGSVPVVRMSNTFMERGTTPVEELFAGIDRGIYLKDGHWGYVFVQKGQFTCHAGQGQEIIDGKLGEPLRDVSISGMTLDTLKHVDAVGNDFEMDMPGMCGKNGQSIPTDAGGPHVRVRKVVVGGR